MQITKYPLPREPSGTQGMFLDDADAVVAVILGHGCECVEEEGTHA